MLDSLIVKERKLTRKELSNYLIAFEKLIGDEKYKLRNQGNLIVNNGDGYFIAQTKEEAKEFLSEYCAAWVSMSETAQVMIESYERLVDNG